MAYASPTVQGSFTQPATGINQIISIPSGYDWIETYNLTQIAAAGAGALKCYWQAGMPQGQGIAFGNSAAVTLTQLAANTGFTFYDSGNMNNQLGTSQVITATTSNTSPVFATGNTTGVAIGSIVRLYNISSGHSVDGLDFVVSAVTANTSFTLGGVFSASPVTSTNPATGSYRVVNYNSGPWAPWYPAYRVIINITTGTSTVVALNVPSNYQVGQEIVFSIPYGYGMTQLDGMTGTITAVSNGTAPTITVNINSTGFTAFTFINTYSVKNRAVVAPVGADTGYILSQNPVGNILNDAVYSSEVKGVLLATGAGSPAGVGGDQVYWIAGRSANVNNM